MITRKWAKGNMITTFDQFDGQEYIWVHGKVYHHGWFKSWQYRYVSDLVKSGQVYEVVNTEYPSGITEKDGEFICSICAEPVLPESKCCPHCGTRLNVNDDTCMIDKSKLLKWLEDYKLSEDKIITKYLSSETADEEQAIRAAGSLETIYELIRAIQRGAFDSKCE